MRNCHDLNERTVFFTGSRLCGQAGIVMALTFALLLLVLWYGMFRLLIGLMPRYGWRIALGGLGLVGAVSNAYFVCYGTIMTPDMVRNALYRLA